jgi:signal transduction histidine kinase
MAELEGFCYSASHDLRTPLRGMIGNSNIVLSDYGGRFGRRGGRGKEQRFTLRCLKVGFPVGESEFGTRRSGFNSANDCGEANFRQNLARRLMSNSASFSWFASS